MHELAIAESILDAVRVELASLPGATPVRVGVKIGVMSAVDADALRFAFEIAVKSFGWTRLQLDARLLPGRLACLACGHQMPEATKVMDCERCHSAQTILCGSDELDFDGLEIETDEDDRGNLAEAKGAEREPENCRQPA